MPGHLVSNARWLGHRVAQQVKGPPPSPTWRPGVLCLMIEGGRIDHGSHAGNACRTLSDAVALNEAVNTVLRRSI
jgi:hypothetical protein